MSSWYDATTINRFLTNTGLKGSSLKGSPLRLIVTPHISLVIPLALPLRNIMTTENGFIIMADYYYRSLYGLALWQIRESRLNENHLYAHDFLATKEEEKL